MDSYAVGNLVRVSVAFADSQGSAVDPEAVNVQVRTPAGTISAKTYGTDDEVVRASAGSYYMDVDADSPGEWMYRWYSTGTGQAAAEGAFTVEASVFTEVEA